mmetsp:Transcript_51997/g.149902  ORF Transcript_51997/g.149902 Transcript_51997/m.149902 type:complete len:222 (-) Transcript_51997:1320-1985(-)
MLKASAAVAEKRSIRGPQQSVPIFSNNLPFHSASFSSSPFAAWRASTFAAYASSSCAEASSSGGAMKGQFSKEYIRRVDFTLPGIAITMSVIVSYANHQIGERSKGGCFAALTAWANSRAISCRSRWTSGGAEADAGKASSLSCNAGADGAPNSKGLPKAFTMGCTGGFFSGKRPRTGRAPTPTPGSCEARRPARGGGATLVLNSSNRWSSRCKVFQAYGV